MLISPPWTLLNIVFYIGFAMLSVFTVYSEYYDTWGTLRYSKFSTGRGLPMRLAGPIVYSLPIVAATATAWPYLPDASTIQLVVYAAIIFHFAKRVLESLFLHKSANTVDIKTMAVILSYYSLIAGTISALNVQTIPAMDIWFYTGMALFLAGEAGNFYHHKLLADLRKNRDGYHIPKGGLFRYVACPHYFFELVAWLGIVFLSRHLFALMAFVTMTAYLSARSSKTRHWYQQRFADYPTERKGMIPFLF
jgi:protein-S-isoprenylcysteine O-methyltransferase Ste14